MSNIEIYPMTHLSARCEPRNISDEEALGARYATSNTSPWGFGPAPLVVLEDASSNESTETGSLPYIASMPVKEARLREGEMIKLDLPPPSISLASTSDDLSLMPGQMPDASIRQALMQPGPCSRLRSALSDVVYPSSAEVGEDKEIPGLADNDMLDKRIGIRPRNKSSAEIQFLLSEEYAKHPEFPASIRKIAHQFMVANGYVSHASHIGRKTKKKLLRSLMVRVDLDKTFSSTRVTQMQQQRLDHCAAQLAGYIAEQSKVWKHLGLLTQTSDDVRPFFHPCTQHWISQEWDGNVALRMPMSRDDILPILPDLSRNDLLRIALAIRSALDAKSVGKESNGHISLPNLHDDDLGLGSEGNGLKSKSTLKRLGDDDREARDSKRRCTDGSPAPASTKIVIDLTSEPSADSRSIELHERSFPQIIDAVNHAHELLAGVAPTTADGLAKLQEDWQSHDHSDTLSEALCVGKFHVKAMEKYFDGALELLSILDGSEHEASAGGMERHRVSNTIPTTVEDLDSGGVAKHMNRDKAGLRKRLRDR